MHTYIFIHEIIYFIYLCFDYFPPFLNYLTFFLQILSAMAEIQTSIFGVMYTMTIC